MLASQSGGWSYPSLFPRGRVLMKYLPKQLQIVHRQVSVSALFCIGLIKSAYFHSAVCNIRVCHFSSQWNRLIPDFDFTCHSF
jgi:hypothetical protein